MTPTVDNVLAVYRRATPKQRSEGMMWYPEMNEFARSLYPAVHVSAGVLAALSPRIQWKHAMQLAQRAFADGQLSGGHFPDNISKANRIINGSDPEHVLGLGRGKKTLNFYRNLVQPYGNEVTVDTWAFRVATGMTTTPTNKDMKILERKGVYEAFADVYREAAVHYGMCPPEMQAITWVVIRGKK